MRPVAITAVLALSLIAGAGCGSSSNSDSTSAGSPAADASATESAAAKAIDLASLCATAGPILKSDGLGGKAIIATTELKPGQMYKPDPNSAPQRSTAYTCEYASHGSGTGVDSASVAATAPAPGTSTATTAAEALANEKDHGLTGVTCTDLSVPGFTDGGYECHTAPNNMNSIAFARVLVKSGAYTVTCSMTTYPADASSPTRAATTATTMCPKILAAATS